MCDSKSYDLNSPIDLKASKPTDLWVYRRDYSFDSHSESQGFLNFGGFKCSECGSLNHTTQCTVCGCGEATPNFTIESK